CWYTVTCRCPGRPPSCATTRPRWRPPTWAQPPPAAPNRPPGKSQSPSGRRRTAQTRRRSVTRVPLPGREAMAVSQTLAGQILAGAGDHDATGIVFDSVTSPVDTTLGALVADAERAAGALRGLGVEPGDVVAVQLPGTYEGAVAQAAVALAGAVLLPIVMIYGRRELDFILRQSRAKVLVTAG